MPVWGVWLDGMVIFSTDPSSRKGRNLAHDARATVHLESGDDVVVLEGKVEQPQDRALLERSVDVYEAKYDFRVTLGEPAYGIYGLRPRIAYSWVENDYPGSATRFRF